MSINNNQRTIIENQSLNAILKHGSIPSSLAFNRYVNEKYDNKTPGLPFLDPVKLQGKSNSKVFNQMLDEINIDLQTLYNTNKIQTLNVGAINEYYDITAKKINDNINILSKLINNNVNVNNYLLTFNNFNQIDFSGDSNRNIPSTNSYIDLINGYVSNEKISTANSKYDISKAQISISNSFNPNDIISVGNINDILNDLSGAYYLYNLKSLYNTPISFNIEIILDETVNATNIQFTFNALYGIDAKLSISEDNINYKSFQIESNSNNIEWNFISQTIKYININITKNTPDGYDGTNYYYYFNFRNISIINEKYKQDSIFISNPIKLDYIYNKINVDIDHNIYPGTNINYYIGIDNLQDNIEWSVLNSNSFNTNLLKSKRKILSSSINNFRLSNYDNCYIISNIDSVVDINSISLIPAYQMWKAEYISLRKAAHYKPTFSDYNLTNFISSTYIDCEQYNLNINAGTLLCLTQYVYCSSPTNLSNKIMNFLNPTADIGFTIYVNNKKVSLLNGKYTLMFKQGKNKVNILVYCHGTSDTDTAQYSFNHNINLKQCGFNVFGESPMQYVNKYNLLNRTYDNNVNYFTVDSGNLLVKHNPLMNTISDDDTGIKYLLTYKYLNKSSNNNIMYDGINPFIYVRIMASLHSDITDISPKINSITLTGE